MTTQIADSFVSDLIHQGFTFGSLPRDDPRILRLDEPCTLCTSEPIDDSSDSTVLSLTADPYYPLNIFDSTACYRQYVARWHLFDGQLYLSHLSGYFKLRDPGPLRADWYSGWLFVDHGEDLSEQYRLWQPLFSNCSAFKCSGGKCIEEAHLTLESGKDPYIQMSESMMFRRSVLDRG